VYRYSEKDVKQHYLLHMFLQYGELRPTEIGSLVWAFQQISMGFGSWLRYCIDVAKRSSSKLCTMFGRLVILGLHTIGLYIVP